MLICDAEKNHRCLLSVLTRQQKNEAKEQRDKERKKKIPHPNLAAHWRRRFCTAICRYLKRRWPGLLYYLRMCTSTHTWQHQTMYHILGNATMPPLSITSPGRRQERRKERSQVKQNTMDMNVSGLSEPGILLRGGRKLCKLLSLSDAMHCSYLSAAPLS